jgi:rSAM/selenodomain-associated transferase 2
MPAQLSTIVPVLNEAEGIVRHLQALQSLRLRGCELIVVDGGSTDGTRDLCSGLVDRLIESPRGRGRQMNAGAAVATAPVLWFVHADTLLPADADRAVLQAITGGAGWGRFDVRVAGSPRMFAVIARMMNLRSRLTGIATGDQAIFVERSLFDRVGGFPDQPLMEDIEISRRLRAVARPACLRQRVLTSGRRWERHGVWRTIWLMWRLRWRYWRGESPESLAQAYR